MLLIALSGAYSRALASCSGVTRCLWLEDALNWRTDVILKKFDKTGYLGGLLELVSGL